ncbi:RNA polymerase sigma factor [Oceanipulchritudo coccoides]|nr:sigma-70 family RNA polymerase sigma factor [Oceanipulchritudo coccoides]
MGTQINADEWHSFFREWSDRLLLFARQQSRSLADAEDILQEAMVQIWGKREVFPRIDSGLLFMQIRRVAIDRARREKRREQREQEYANADDGGFFESRKPGDALDLEQALRALPNEQQEVLVLKIWGGQSFEAIGRTLDISPNTAASRYRYGLEHLRSNFQIRELK